MGRPSKVIPSQKVTICLPQDLLVEVKLFLWSNVEERVPHGAWQKYLVGLITADLSTRREHAKAGPIMGIDVLRGKV